MQRGHPGATKTLQLLKDRYSYGISRRMVEAYNRRCGICGLGKKQMCQERLVPVRSTSVNARLQIDLVDMRHNKCTKNLPVDRTIFQIRFHRSYDKFNVIWPMEHRSAEEVVNGLERNVFCYFGLPGILRSDNGKEFKNKLVAELLTNWEGSCKTIYGRPRHPQSQGLVEQSNGTMEKMIVSMIAQCKHNGWVDFLPKIMFNMNTQRKEFRV